MGLIELKSRFSKKNSRENLFPCFRLLSTGCPYSLAHSPSFCLQNQSWLTEPSSSSITDTASLFHICFPGGTSGKEPTC